MDLLRRVDSMITRALLAQREMLSSEQAGSVRMWAYARAAQTVRTEPVSGWAGGGSVTLARLVSALALPPQAAKTSDPNIQAVSP